MTHKWKKRHQPINVQIDDFYHYISMYSICEKCGLKKGLIRNLSHFPILVYFKRPIGYSYDKVISKERIPYKCDENIEIHFLTMDDMEKIDEHQFEFIKSNEMEI